MFDVQSWRKLTKDMHLEYDKLEDKPQLPMSMTGATPATAVAQSQQQAHVQTQQQQQQQQPTFAPVNSNFPIAQQH